MIIAFNHKSNLKREEYLNYLQDISKIITDHTLIICPSFINISNPYPNNIHIGSQNVSRYNSGAHTGEISVQQLKSYNVEYSLVGHSERRMEQGETDETINKKIKLLLENNIAPILCVGESRQERSTGKTEEVLQRQIEMATKDLNKNDQKKIIIAYEPTWAIGTGLIPSNRDIKKSIIFIKKQLPMSSVLYGGSVNEENIEIIKKISEIDGYLLGGLSLRVDKIKKFLSKV